MVHGGPVGKDDGCQPVEARLRPLGVVIDAPELERLQAPGFRDFGPAMLRPPGVEGGVADPVPAADLRHRSPAWCSFSTPMICSSPNLLCASSVSFNDGL